MVLLRRSSALAYLVAILGSALVVLAGSSSHGSVGALLTPILFILAVLAAGTLGGWKPSLLATVLSVAGAVYFVLEPRYTFRVSRLSDLFGSGEYLVGGLVISTLCEGLHAFTNRIIERQRRLEEEITERRRAELEVHEHADRLREADRRKDDFLATLATRVRNPLAPLSMRVRLAARRKRSLAGERPRDDAAATAVDDAAHRRFVRRFAHQPRENSNPPAAGRYCHGCHGSRRGLHAVHQTMRS